MNSRIDIDPLHLTEQTSQLLSEYLSRTRKNGLFLERGKTLFLGMRRLALKYSMVLRLKAENIWHYDVLANHVSSKGGVSLISDVIGVLKESFIPNENHRLILKRKLKRIYKIQENDALAEYAIMQRCSHLRARGLFAAIPSMISLRKFAGQSLADVIHHDRHNEPLSLDQRYLLTINLLRTFKEQISDRMLCHKDLKPQDIFYDKATGAINIFDLGLSCYVNEKFDQRSRGNSVFSAPEEFTCSRTDKPVTAHEFDVYASMKSVISFKLDIYSLGRIVGLFWRDRDPIFSDKSGGDRVLRNRAVSGWRVKFKLFDGIQQLDRESKIKIYQQLIAMTLQDPEHRCDLNACLSAFQNLYLEYKLKNSDLLDRELLIQAHQLAITQLREIDEIHKNSELCLRLNAAMKKFEKDFELPLTSVMTSISRGLTTKFSAKYQLLIQDLRQAIVSLPMAPDVTVNHFMTQLALLVNLAFLQQSLLRNMQKLSDNSGAVRHFVELIHIRCLSGIEDKFQLINKVNTIVDLFNTHFENLRQLMQHEVVVNNIMLNNDLQHFMQVIHSKAMTLDNVMELIEQIDHKLHKVQSDFRHLILQPWLGN